MKKIKNFDTIMSNKSQTEKMLKAVTGREMTVQSITPEVEGFYTVIARGEAGEDFDIRLKVVDSEATEMDMYRYVRMADRAQDPFSKGNYQIYFTERDMLGKNLPVYHVGQVIEGSGEAYPFSTSIVYINTDFDGEWDEELEGLIHDLI